LFFQVQARAQLIWPARCFHGDAEILHLLPGRGQTRPDRQRDALGHGVAGIREQAQEQLPQLLAIRVHPARRGGAGPNPRLALAGCLSAGRVITDLRTARTGEKNRSRVETRTLTPRRLPAEASDWPHWVQVFKLERGLCSLQTGQIQTDVVYGLTSLTAEEASPQRLLAKCGAVRRGPRR
jgi:hypothetical protein